MSEEYFYDMFIGTNYSNNWSAIISNAGKVNPNQRKDVFVIDNFFENPMRVHDIALNSIYSDGIDYVGKRTRKQYIFEGVKERFEKILDLKIIDWEKKKMNGSFQSCNAGTPIVYGCNDHAWAGIIFLSPNAPPSTGIRLFRHKATGITHNSHPRIMETFNAYTFLDRTPYEMIDEVGNVFNRLVIFNGGLIHAPSEYFGWDIPSSHLSQIYFFNTEKEDYDRRLT